MKIEEVKAKAKALGLKNTFGMSKAGLIRSVQKAEGNFDRNVPRPAKAGLAGSLPTGRQEGAQYERNFLCSHPARHCVPGKPRPVGRELHCFGTAKEFCDQFQCCFREDCIKSSGGGRD